MGTVKDHDSLHANRSCYPFFSMVRECDLVSFFFTDSPLSVVTFGRSLNPKSILEGADVYFECHVKSNPPFYNITWRNNVSEFFFPANSAPARQG